MGRQLHDLVAHDHEHGEHVFDFHFMGTEQATANVAFGIRQ